jgi:hypothetical protein
MLKSRTLRVFDVSVPTQSVGTEARATQFTVKNNSTSILDVFSTRLRQYSSLNLSRQIIEFVRKPNPPYIMIIDTMTFHSNMYLSQDMPQGAPVSSFFTWEKVLDPSLSYRSEHSLWSAHHRFARSERSGIEKSRFVPESRYSFRNMFYHSHHIFREIFHHVEQRTLARIAGTVHV